ncbi:MAG TPA: diguanylate cyclase [Solirubrobacteraceae bacterium]|nr:diguanylate cyclase [Solirubrobacteraceae bacterium]
MDEDVDEGPRESGEEDPALDPLLVAPTAVLEGLPDAVVAAAPDGRIVFVNAVAEELFGYPRRELLGQPVQTLWPERVRDRYTRNMELYFATEHPMRFTIAAWGLRRDGSEFIGQMSWGVVETNAGSLLLAVGRDISDQRAAEARLRAVASMGERALAGADPADLANDAVGQLRNLLPVTAAEVRLADGSALATFGPVPETGMRLTIGAGGELFVTPARALSEEELSFVRAVAHTLASGLARLRDEERMRHEAVHDPLTGLANRTLLRDRLEHALARFERDRGETGVLFVDLDNFKQINDAHGHAAGDAALVELSRRLQTAVRPGDTIARLGGDEFVALCEHVDEESALAVGRRLLEAIRLPFTAGGADHELSASIGIALGHSDPEVLLANADAATYRAKAAGRGRIELFR